MNDTPACILIEICRMDTTGKPSEAQVFGRRNHTGLLARLKPVQVLTELGNSILDGRLKRACTVNGEGVAAFSKGVPGDRLDTLSLEVLC